MYNKNLEKLFLIFEVIIFLIGGVVSSFVLVYLLLNNQGGFILVGSILMVIAYGFIIIVGTFDLKKSKILFLVSTISFILAITINIFLPFRNVFQIVVLTLLLISIVLFVIFNNNFKLGLIFITLSIIISFIFSIYSSNLASTDNVSYTRVIFLTNMAMYLSIASPSILCLTYFIAYFNKNAYL